MSVALPAVNGTTSFTGFVGQLWPAAAPATSAHSAKAANFAPSLMVAPVPLRQSIADRNILGLEREPRGQGFEHDQFGEVLVVQPAPDQRLDNVARRGSERQRDFEAA